MSELGGAQGTSLEFLEITRGQMMDQPVLITSAVKSI